MLAVSAVRAFDWTIMSTLTFASARAPKIVDDTPGWSGKPKRLIFASSRL